MANFKLNRAVIGDIEFEVGKQTAKRVAYAQAGFPMSQDELQAATLDPSITEQMRALAGKGVALPTEQRPDIMLRRFADLTPEGLAGLKRDCVVQLRLTEPFYALRTTHYYASESTPGTRLPVSGVGHVLILGRDALPEGREPAMVAWANELVLMTRVGKLVNATVEQVLKLCPSVGELVATWPLLATLATDKLWRDRFRNPGRVYQRYRVPVAQELRNRMIASEAFLNGSLMMPDLDMPKGAITATLTNYERLTGDQY